MTTQYQIRKAFTNHWCDQENYTGKNAWLIKGDFDRFKLTNDLYGSLICDYLLDWTLEVVELEIKSQQERWGREDLLWNFVGDDVTLYIPPCGLLEEDIEQFLRRICRSIERSFFQRYKVAALPLPVDFFEDVPADSLEIMRNELERMEVVFDFARRQRGYIVLFPVTDEDSYSPILEDVLQVIRLRSGKNMPLIETHLDWICDPERGVTRTFNQGFLRPPSISFAACSIDTKMEAGSVSHDRRSAYERISLVCQSALKKCKQQRGQVIIQKFEPVAPDTYLQYRPAGVLDTNSPLRWSSERYLRERLYFRRLDHPVLFQFNPVYRSSSPRFVSAVFDETLAVEKYRGNKYGVGLKGINEIFGHNAATCLIGELMAAFSQAMLATLVTRDLPPDQVHIARFVDRFTVCCEQSLFQLIDILELVRRLAGRFNCVSDEIKISHLRTNVVFGEEQVVGFRLFQQLALTGLSPQSVVVENSDPPIEVRQSRFDSVLQAGSLALERNSFLSADLLDTCL